MPRGCWSRSILPPRSSYCTPCKTKLCLSYLHCVVGLSLTRCKMHA
jgi:hypothetical protein